METTLEEFEEALVNDCSGDIELLCDLLQIDVYDILDAFENKLLLYKERVERDNIEDELEDEY